MSTILKALRRLENEDPRKKNAGTPLVLRDPEAGSPAAAHPPAPPHPAPHPATDPRAADALRNRILAEEAAARVGNAARADTPETSRRWRPLVLAAIAAALVIAAIPFALTRTRHSDPADTGSDLASDPVSETTAAAARDITAAAETASAPGTLSRTSPEPAEPPARAMVAVESPAAPAAALAAAPAPPVLPVLSAPAAPKEVAAVSPPATATGPGAPSAERPPIPERAQTAASAPTPSPMPSPMPADRTSAPSPVSRPPAATRASETAQPRPASDPPNDFQRVSPAGLPEIHVVRTAWHPKPERRSARVRVSSTDELITAHEGQTVAGLVIQEITPSAVVFSAGDVEIRRRVGDDPSRR